MSSGFNLFQIILKLHFQNLIMIIFCSFYDGIVLCDLINSVNNKAIDYNVSSVYINNNVIIIIIIGLG